MKGKKVEFKRKSNVDYIISLINPIRFITFIIHLIKLLAYYYVNFSYGKQMIKVGKKTKIHPTVILRQAERISIGNNCLINHNNILQAGKKEGEIIIGDYVQTGANVMMFAFNHSITKTNIPMINQDYFDSSIIIENDVWIGAGSIILSGVKIGKGSVIGSGSVVTKNIPEYSIAVGNPAKVIKNRI